MRSTLVTALVAFADSARRAQARRLVQGLSGDELQFIAEFLGTCVIEPYREPCVSRAQWAERITRYQAACDTCGCADREHKMILLLEYLCRAKALRFETPALWRGDSSRRLAG